MWSSSSIPTEAAWAVLKRDGGRDKFDLTQVMDPADVKAASSYFESLPPEKQMVMQQVNEAFHKMPDNAKGQLLASAHKMFEEHRGKLKEALDMAPDGDVPESTSPGTFKITKFIPLVVAGVFALDALNRSQGSKASLVGNVFTDMGNAISPGQPFGETDYSDVFDYEDTASYIHPITGEPIGEPIENPSMWQRISRGAVSAIGSLINPFAVVGGTARASGRAFSSAKEGASRLGAQATKKVGEKTGIKGLQTSGQAGIDRTARNKARRLEELDTFYDKTGGRGAYGVTSRTAGAGSRGNLAYRTAQGLLHSPKIRQMAGSVGAGLLGNTGSPNISGTASATPSGGAAGTGVANIGNRQSSDSDYEQIWTKRGGKGILEAQREAEGGGAYGTNKGDNMKIGEQILKETKERMDKAHCMGDTEHKGDKKGSKKPAHGMIIVLGAQGTGPGPSKDGKRTKK
jgi:hypothetical protein